MPNMDNQTVQLAIIAVIALAVLVQTVVLLAIFLAVRTAAHSLHENVEDLRSSMMPTIYKTRELLADAQAFFTRVAPKAEATASDFAEIARGLREQVEEIESAASELVERVRNQTGRLDAMATGALNSVDRAGSFVAEIVTKPVREISRLLAAAKAIIEALLASELPPRQSRSGFDEEPFARHDDDPFA